MPIDNADLQSLISGVAKMAPPSAGAPRPLIIDALNKLNYFIPWDDPDLAGAPPWELIAAMQTRLTKFIDACKASDFEPHFVVDNGWVTDEARDKWTERKTAEAGHLFPAGRHVIDTHLEPRCLS
jgi:hypothetical protein